MKSRFWQLVGAMIIVSSVACTQQLLAQKKKKPSVKETKEVNSLLWKISGNGLQKPSYLFGTIHMICKDAYFWTDKMQSAFDATDKVCMEMDLDDPMLQMQVASKMMLQDGKTLKDFFTEEEYQIIGNYLKDSFDFDIQSFQLFKPVALLMIISQKSMSCENNATESYEKNLMQMAQKNSKEILGLETAEDQLNALESLPHDSLVKMLIKYSKGDTKSAGYDINDLVNAYTQQDLQTIKTLIGKMEKESGNMKGLLDDRNKNWIPKMEKMMQDNAVFFAVGAAHLPSKIGVIYLLRQAGYTVAAIM